MHVDDSVALLQNTIQALVLQSFRTTSKFLYGVRLNNKVLHERQFLTADAWIARKGSIVSDRGILVISHDSSPSHVIFLPSSYKRSLSLLTIRIAAPLCTHITHDDLIRR